MLEKPTPDPRVPSPYQSFQELRWTMEQFRRDALETLKKMKQRQETAIAVTNSKLSHMEQRLTQQRRWMLVVWAIALVDLGLHIWFLWRR